MNVAFVFPGQGAQTEGFLHRLPKHDEITKTLEEAGHILGLDVLSLDGPNELACTALVQQALVIAGVASARALLAERITPLAVAGMSIGAFGAAVACRALAFDDALRIARLRGERMEAAFAKGYGLAAIEGLDENRVDRLAHDVSTPAQPVAVSNVNAPRQIVVAGSDSALATLMIRARANGAYRAERLDVAVPSHTSLLQPVAEELRRAFAGIPLRAPSVPYVSNRGGRALYDAASIRDDLVESVAHRVRWYDALEIMRELGATTFFEMPPGHVSTHLVANLIPDVKAISVADRGLPRAA